MTSLRHNQVGYSLGRFDKLQVHGFQHTHITFHHRLSRTSAFYHIPLEAILGMYQAILPSANSLIKCLVIFNMPFTLVKGLLDAVLCMVIYKPLSPILHGRK